MFGSIAAAFAALAFSAIGIGALLAPRKSSAQYGLPTTDRTGLALFRALGARDLVLGIIMLLLVARRNRDALEVALGISVLVAVGDVAAVITGRNDTSTRLLGVHVGGGAGLLVAWRLVRSGH